MKRCLSPTGLAPRQPVGLLATLPSLEHPGLWFAFLAEQSTKPPSSAREHRSIYYQDEELFKQQSVVDNLVDDLAYTLGIGREDLGIVATGKGLVVGPILIRTKPGYDFDPSSRTPSELDASSSAAGVLIPPARDISQIDFGFARWVLVIEKDATFRTLAAARYWDTSACGRGIIVTGSSDAQARAKAIQIWLPSNFSTSFMT
ncbi:type IIB DNA topoisomerase [Colletotrichum tofieldiae]|nr:type IIB DNA topoisomerase [Colletotrichum tofieldiae]GKT84434.1 type IIB DNA topoisomerase [Colletotrichum tofieldiae]